MIIINRYMTLKCSDFRNDSYPTINDAQNSVLAGVGTPIKDEVCLVSKLNLASLSAEKAAIRNAVYGMYSCIGARNAGHDTE